MSFPPALLDEIRAATPLVALIGGAVPLKRNGARRWMGRCPFHADRSPSFSVVEDRGFFHCFGCGAHGDAFGWMMRRDGLDFIGAVRELAGRAGIHVPGQSWERAAPAPPAQPAVAAPRPADDAPGKIEVARRMWLNAGRIADDGVVAAYLRRRRLWPLPASAHAVLRQTKLRHRDTAAKHDVMLARADGPDGEPCGVHRTYLAPDGAKLAGVSAKLALGVFRGAAIRLAAPAGRMGFGEGIETSLAAWALHGVPCWACISAGGLQQLRWPFDLEDAVVFADRDRPSAVAPEGPGMLAARLLAARLAAAGIRHEIRMPNAPNGDYADVLAGLALAA